MCGTQKIFRGVWKKLSPQKELKMSIPNSSAPWFWKEIFKIRSELAFASIYFDWCVVRSQFFHCRKLQGQTHLINSWIIHVRRTENFLEAFEKNLSPQKELKMDILNYGMVGNARF